MADLPLSAGRSCSRQRLARGKGRKAISLAMERIHFGFFKGFFLLDVVCPWISGIVMFLLMAGRDREGLIKQGCSNNEESQSRMMIVMA